MHELSQSSKSTSQEKSSLRKNSGQKYLTGKRRHVQQQQKDNPVFAKACLLNRLYRSNSSCSQEVSPLLNFKSDEELKVGNAFPNDSNIEKNKSLIQNKIFDNADRVAYVPETSNVYKMIQNEASETKKIIDCEEILLKETKEAYDSAIEAAGSLFSCAKNIISMVESFYQSKNPSSYVDELKSFLRDNICLSVKGISEKYKNCLSSDAMERKIKEYQLQAILALEQEVLSPASESICVDNVTAVLRMMSFLSGPVDLKCFLHNVLKENYFEKLRSILIEIGDELNIPIIPEDDSASASGSEMASTESLSDINIPNSLPSSADMSCSSTSSIKSNRIRFQKRSDIERSRRGREIMIPVILKKNRRPKLRHTSDDLSKLKSSPHFGSKKFEKKKHSAENETKMVRRNLFSIEKENEVSKTSPTTPNPFRRKRKPLPEKGQILKTKFVAATPSPKQKRFGMKRPDSAVKEQSSVKTIAESPKICQSKKDASNLRMLKYLQRSQTVSYATTSPDVEAKSLEARRIIQYTPDSKRRLSLKLFSKLLTSPTANRGPKRCSKRLFEPSTPKSSKTSDSCKRMRFSVPSQNDMQTEHNAVIEQKDIELKTPEATDHRSPLIIKRAHDHKKSPMLTQTPSTSYSNANAKKYTPPTSLSLLHLTTSPLLNLNPKSPLPNEKPS